LIWGGEFSQAGLGSNIAIRYLGRIEDPNVLAILYSACDLFVCPSRADNLPNTCIEAIACGVPVLGSDAGGIPDIVKNGTSGWLFLNDDYESLQSSLLVAIEQMRYGINFSISCVQHAKENFDVGKTASRYAELLSDLVVK